MLNVIISPGLVQLYMVTQIATYYKIHGEEVLVSFTNGDVLKLRDHGYAFELFPNNIEQEAVARILSMNIDRINIVCWFIPSYDQTLYKSRVRGIINEMHAVALSTGRKLAVSISFYPDALHPFYSDDIKPGSFFGLPEGSCQQECRHLISFDPPKRHISIPLYYSDLDVIDSVAGLTNALKTELSKHDSSNAALILLCTRPWGLSEFHGGAYDLGDLALTDILHQSVECVLRRSALSKAIVLLKLDHRHSKQDCESIVASLKSKYGSALINLEQFLPSWCTLDFVLPALSTLPGKRLWLCSQDSTAPMPFLPTDIPMSFFLGCDEKSEGLMPSTTANYISHKLDLLLKVAESNPSFVVHRCGKLGIFIEPAS
jgi:hypothetical protein